MAASDGPVGGVEGGQKVATKRTQFRMETAEPAMSGDDAAARVYMRSNLSISKASLEKLDV
ncbi:MULTISPECIES: hypothetical protein [Mesorhizobium]|uniref:hypothetical protein n=1 Tax=Mesorhizobium TaxID=68287 RepID=UPI0007ECFCEF|nr:MULTISPECIES: hypothetical protein [Mesorhizobium]QIA25260.1 hypothetical protein A9K68_028450 [Mesorhizobium sp. AA22]